MTVDVKKINNTVSEMEEQVQKLKAVSKVYKELGKLQDEIAAGVEAYETVSNDVNDMAGRFKELLDKQTASWIELNEGFNEFRNGLNRDMEDLGRELLDKQDVRWKQLQDDFDKFQNDVNRVIKGFSEENKKLYKALEDAVFLRLEKHRSDIQMDIRNEGSLVERTLKNSMDDKFANVERNIKERFDGMSSSIDKKFGKEQVLILSVAALSVINLIMLVIMMIKK